MPHIITSLCIKDGACVAVCPQECIVPSEADSEWHWTYIDPSRCTDCGACIPACPLQAIFTEDDVPDEYQLLPYQEQVLHETGEHYVANGDEVVNLRQDIVYNYEFFAKGPGYSALKLKKR